MATRRQTREQPSLAGAPWLADTRVQAILALLNAEGGEARVAGGAVRNALLGVPVADIDIATTLSPQEVKRRCLARQFAVHPTGIEHGTVTVVVQHMPFEVTTLRRDVSTDGRRATVAFTGDWAEDAGRRDFTMNAMYCDAAGNVYDYSDGYKDVLHRKVKFVGTPSRRIREDYLRILRFFRFHATYGKGAPDAAGLAACTRLRKGIENLSAERIRQELLKILVAPRAVETLKVMAASHILERVLDHVPAWRMIARLPADSVLRLSALARHSAGLRNRLRLSNEEARRLQQIAEAPTLTPELHAHERHRILYALGAEAWRDAVHMSLAQSRAPLDHPAWRELLMVPDRWPMPTFPVSGRDLQAAGLAPGPAMGQTLRSLEDWWIASDFKPTREELLARAKQ